MAYKLIAKAEPPYTQVDVEWSEHDTHSEAMLAMANARLTSSRTFVIERV